MNLLLITVDTLRPDHLGCYGSTAPTPTIDALCARSLVFDDATATAPTTLPSHVSILAGSWVHTTGIDSNNDTVPPSLALVSDHLAAAGYHTAAFVSGRPVARSSGLGSHFQTFDDRLPDALGGGEFPPERRAAGTVAAAVEWLAVDHSPFFLWVHLYDPHLPYTATAGASYDAEVADVDRAVRTLLSAVPHDTATVLVADHGESLGEHGERTHGVFLYQSTLRVPLLVNAPGLPPRRRSEPVSTVDIAPTLLRLANLPENLPGVDLRGPIPTDRLLYSGTIHGWERYGWAPLQAIRLGRRKAIDAPQPEVYDVVADPAERTRLVDPSFAGRFPPATAAETNSALDPTLAAQLVALGYAASEPATRTDAPDPKDRIALLPALEAASRALYENRPAEAERLLRPVVTADPTNPAAHNDLGMALIRLNRPTDAMTVLRRATELSPRDPMIWTNLGFAATQSKDLATARRAYQTAADLAPTFAAPCLNRAMLEYRAGDLSAARRWVNEALARDPNLAEARALDAQLPR